MAETLLSKILTAGVSHFPRIVLHYVLFVPVPQDFVFFSIPLRRIERLAAVRRPTRDADRTISWAHVHIWIVSSARVWRRATHFKWRGSAHLPNFFRTGKVPFDLVSALYSAVKSSLDVVRQKATPVLHLLVFFQILKRLGSLLLENYLVRLAALIFKA